MAQTGEITPPGRQIPEQEWLRPPLHTRWEHARLVFGVLLGVLSPLGALAAILLPTAFGVRIGVGVAAVSCAIAAGITFYFTTKAKRRLDEDVRKGLLYGPIVPFSKADRDQLGVDPPEPEALKLAALDSEQPNWKYVRRDQDEELALALRAARDGAPQGRPLVVMWGQSKAGKSCSLFEVASKELADAHVVAPRDRDGLLHLLEPGVLPGHLRGGQLVVWLRDLEEFVGVGGQRGLDAETLKEIHSLAQPALVIAASGGKGAELYRGSPQLEDPVRTLVQRQDLCWEVKLEPQLNGEELERARGLYALDRAPELKAIGEFMVAAPALVRKLQQGFAPGESRCLEGQAVAWAAIDWRRCGLLRTIPREMLRELVTLQPEVNGLDVADASFAAGLQWATAPRYTVHRLVWAVSGGFQPDNLIVLNADRDKHLQRDVNSAVWDHILQRASAEDAFALGLAALERAEMARREDPPSVIDRGLWLDRGLTAYRRADELGSGEAAANLGVLLMESDAEGALAAHRRADERGSAAGAYNLGILLEAQGDVPGALAAFRRAGERGSAHGALWLGWLLARAGDLDGADGALSAFRRADERGSAEGAVEVGMYLASHDMDGALRAFRRADERGSADGAVLLGGALVNGGDIDGAIDACRRADERGSAHGALRLGTCLLRKHNIEGALGAFRRADERGSPEGANSFGGLLNQIARGDPDRAVIRFNDAWRDQVATKAHSHVEVDSNTGVLGNLEGQVPEEVIAAFRRADKRGSANGATNVGGVHEQRGNVKAALGAYRRADRRGGAGGAYRLGVLLEQAGDTEEALAAYRRADERGSADGAAHLGSLLEQAGDTEGALAAYRRADERDGGSRTLHGG